MFFFQISHKKVYFINSIVLNIHKFYTVKYFFINSIKIINIFHVLFLVIKKTTINEKLLKKLKYKFQMTIIIERMSERASNVVCCVVVVVGWGNFKK